MPISVAHMHIHIACMASHTPWIHACVHHTMTCMHACMHVHVEIAEDLLSFRDSPTLRIDFSPLGNWVGLLSDTVPSERFQHCNSCSSHLWVLREHSDSNHYSVSSSSYLILVGAVVLCTSTNPSLSSSTSSLTAVQSSMA